jgi:hypothetical protein
LKIANFTDKHYANIEAAEALRSLEKQLDKYVNPENLDFMNPYRKKVVLVIDKLNGVTLKDPGFRRLEKMGVMIINGIEKIKTLY